VVALPQSIEEPEDSGLPLSSAERLAFPASLKTTIEAMPQTAEAEPPQLVRAGAGKASLTALGCGKPPAPLPAIGFDLGFGTFEAA